MSVILGIDPGLTRTGWGIIQQQQNQLRFIAAGVFATKPSNTLAERLVQHATALHEIIAQYKPDAAAIEQTFVSVNGASTLKLGQARGALLLTLAQAGLPISEYAANLVKKTVTGSGHADKTQVAALVKLLLPKCDVTRADATDALAIAICHAHHFVHV
jgi:crossover junction endodeoxyribonuclease RuvC